MLQCTSVGNERTNLGLGVGVSSVPQQNLRNVNTVHFGRDVQRCVAVLTIQ